LIRRYFEACSSGSSADIAACFTAEAVVYDTNLAPVAGAERAAQFWLAVRRRWGGARWVVDHAVAEGDHAACEWTMSGRAPADGRPFAFRGSDHYRFEGDLIAEVRQYWTFDPARLDTGLVGFPYSAADDEPASGGPDPGPAAGGPGPG
jgi:ketosteroid isomerase-like protein